MKYSALKLVGQALSGNKGWKPAWRDPTPKSGYEVIIIGGGGHGLATAYYLAKNHGVKNIAVLEKGWLGGGNTGRNTMAIRTDYMLDAHAGFYNHSLDLWKGLSQDLNYNIMFAQRGIMYLCHSMGEIAFLSSRFNNMALKGNKVRVLSVDDIRELEPGLNFSKELRYPIVGALLMEEAGPARHDAVAWGFARGADSYGVDIIQNCEVTGIKQEGGRVVGVDTTRGHLSADRVGIAVAGSSSELTRMIDLKLPMETHLLQACVTEPVKPFLKTMLGSDALHFYLTQTAKGEIVIGGPLDGYSSYTQRGAIATIEHILMATVELFPQLSRLRLLRAWGGMMDMTMDGSPIIAKTPVDNLYLNGGWCYGGFKATPASGWTFAHTIANDEPHHLVKGLNLERFASGHTVDENGAGPYPKSH